MGRAGSKLSNVTSPSAAKNFNPELEFRTSNLKRLKAAYKSIKASLRDVLSNMETVPRYLTKVGNGYTSLGACLNYSGGGSHVRSAEGTAAVEDGNGNAQPQLRLDRELADESLKASKDFCAAMESMSAVVCPKHRADIQTKVLSEVDTLLASVERVTAQGKKAADTMCRYVSARQAVQDKEKQASKKGKDLSSDASYTKLVSDCNSKESVYKTELEHFDEQYENLMGESQAFAAETTESFLDATVGYYHEMVVAIDNTATLTRSKTRSRSRADATANPVQENHEPATQNYFSNGNGCAAE